MRTVDLILEWIDVSLRSKLRWLYYGPGGVLLGILLIAALVVAVSVAIS